MGKQLTPEILDRIVSQLKDDEEALFANLPDVFIVELGAKNVLTDKATFKEFMRHLVQFATVEEVTRELESWGRDAMRFDTNRLDTLLEKRLGTKAREGEQGA